MTSIKVWITFAQKVVDTAYSIFEHPLTIGAKGGGEVDVLAVTLLARSVEHMRGILTLADAGLLVEARIILRSLFENELWIGGLLAEGEKFADRMLHDEVKNRQARGHLLFNNETSRESLPDKGEKLRAWIRESKTEFPSAELLRASTVAEIGSIGDAYIFYVQLSADAAHPSIEALSRHIVTDPEKPFGIQEIDVAPTPKPEQLQETLSLACSALLGACIGVNQILGGTEGGKALDSLASEIIALMRAARDPLAA